MKGRILTKAEIDELPAFTQAELNLLATVQAMRELLDDALVDYARAHRPGCLGTFHKGANADAARWPCTCGLHEWREKAKKLLG